MPHLLKAVSQDRKAKAFVTASSLEELITNVQKKFKCNAETQYIVYQEPSGVEIDSTDVLLLLCDDAKSSNTYVEVMIVAEGIKWPDPKSEHIEVLADPFPMFSSTLSSPLPKASNEHTEDSRLDSEEEHQHETRGKAPTRATRPLPMKDIVESLDNALRLFTDARVPTARRMDAKKQAIKTAYTIVQKHMEKSKDYTLTTARKYGKSIINYNNNYKKLFEIKVGDVVVSDGVETFVQKIYNAVKYRQPDEGKKEIGKHKRKDLEDEDYCEDEVGGTMDEYGCVAYHPELPEDECQESQEEKRIQLLSLDTSDPTVLQLMKKTFATQRMHINRARPLTTKLPAVFEKWPHLAQECHLIHHADHLLGKKTKELWLSEIGRRRDSINGFFTYFWKKAELRHSTLHTTEMLGVIEARDNANISSRSREGSNLAIFPFIVGYMKDDVGLIFKVMPSETSDEDMVQEVKRITQNPLLVIRGVSLFDPDGKICVVIGKIIIKTESALMGFLINFLSYYVFNFCYPIRLSSSMEFIQRFFLCINPEKGTKRGDAKRSMDSIDSKVRDLSDSIASHVSIDWNISSADQPTQ